MRARQMGSQGQPSRLRPELAAAVAVEILTGRFRTGEQIRSWIAAEFGVAPTLAGIHSLLERPGCSPKLPRPLHEKAVPAAPEALHRGARGSARRGGREHRDAVRLRRGSAGGPAGDHPAGLGALGGEGASTGPGQLGVALPVRGSTGARGGCPGADSSRWVPTTSSPPSAACTRGERAALVWDGARAHRAASV